MSTFEPSKQHLREVLLFMFNSKKSAAESHRLLLGTYTEHSISIKMCEYWFRRFKSGDFDIEDKERSGQPKKFEDEELTTLLDEDSCQTLRGLTTSLEVDESTVSRRLKFNFNFDD